LSISDFFPDAIVGYRCDDTIINALQQPGSGSRPLADANAGGLARRIVDKAIATRYLRPASFQLTTIDVQVQTQLPELATDYADLIGSRSRHLLH
jgi:hypothetical protein